MIDLQIIDINNKVSSVKTKIKDIKGQELKRLNIVIETIKQGRRIKPK